MNWCLIRWKIVVSAVCLAPMMALAGSGKQVPFIEEHGALVMSVMGAAFIIIGFFIIRILNQNDKQHTDMIKVAESTRKELAEVNEKQWTAIGNLTSDLANTISEFRELRVEHNLIKGYCHFRHTDKEVHHHERQEDPPCAFSDDVEGSR